MRLKGKEAEERFFYARLAEAVWVQVICWVVFSGLDYTAQKGSSTTALGLFALGMPVVVPVLYFITRKALPFQKVLLVLLEWLVLTAMFTYSIMFTIVHNVWVMPINPDSVLNGVEFQAFGFVFGLIPTMAIMVGEVALCAVKNINSKKNRRQ